MLGFPGVAWFSGKGCSAGHLLWTGDRCPARGRWRWPAFSLRCYPSSLLVTFVFKDIQRCLLLRVLFSKKLPCSLEMISHFQKREFTGFFCPSVLCSEDACWQRGSRGAGAAQASGSVRPGSAPHRLCDVGPSLSELLLLSLRRRECGSHYWVLTSVSNRS